MLLEIKDIWVHYDGAEVIKGVSLQVNEGSMVTLIGNNGAGKTTTLMAISGLKHPTFGEIWFQGQRIDKKDPEYIVKLGIAHCPEGRRLFPLMTVLENLLMGAYLRKDTLGIKNDMEIIYESFPTLKERAKQEAGTLSGGQQQMLAIARAFISKPKLILLDEPSLGLSPLMVQEVARIITNIHCAGMGTLLVEQNSLLALKIADFAYVLDTGEVRLQGKAQELLNDPRVKEAYLG